MKTQYIFTWFGIMMAITLTSLMGIINPFAVVAFGLTAIWLMLIVYSWKDHFQDEEQRTG